MSTNPSVGQWVWGQAKTPCQVIDIGIKRSTGQTMLRIAHPQGQKVVIPLDKVRGFSDTPPLWKLPAIPRTPKPGQRVKLKNTKLEFTIGEIHSVRDGSDNGEPTFETWAKLQTHDGRAAHWKLQQLEAIA